MKEFAAFEYLLIAIADSCGLDKLQFEERIQWAVNQGKNIFHIADVEDAPKYLRSTQELQRVIQGDTQSGYMMALDASASGTQLLSCMSGDSVGASHCGLVDPNKRCDIYTTLVETMNQYLDNPIGLDPDGLTRADCKNAFMTFWYYSEAEPRNTFGEGTAELAAFYTATKELCPGASELMEDIAGCISEDRTQYNWDMPDGFEVRTHSEIYKDVKCRLEELPNAAGNPSTYTHRVYSEGVDPHCKAVVANFVHSVDGYIVREMTRRTGIDRKVLRKVYNSLQVTADRNATEKCISLAHINQTNKLSVPEQSKLKAILEPLLDMPQFDLVTVHDSFAAMPKYMNQVRWLYRELLAEITESDLTQSMLQQLYMDDTLQYQPHRNKQELAKAIRQSNYALC